MVFKQLLHFKKKEKKNQEKGQDMEAEAKLSQEINPHWNGKAARQKIINFQDLDQPETSGDVQSSQVSHGIILECSGLQPGWTWKPPKMETVQPAPICDSDLISLY